MPNMQASPRNSLLGYLSDKLATGKGYANKYEILPQIPLLGGTGLGDLFLGKSPELLDDMSYNMSSAIRGGNRATGGLGTYTLDKRSADLGMTMADIYGLSKGFTSLGKYGAKKLIDKSGFDETRRAFLEGKAEGRAKPTNETVSTSLDAINEVLQKPISRRDLVKKGAITVGGVGALAVTPSLLRNFTKEVEHSIPKVIEHSSDNIANTTGKTYKYNTLKDYFNDINELSLKHYNEDIDNFDFRLSPEEMDDLFKSHYKNNLELDEKLYNNAKEHQKNLTNMFDDPQALGMPEYMTNRLNAFSPEAKQEMSLLKGYINNKNRRKNTDYTHPAFGQPDYHWTDSNQIYQYMNPPTEFPF